MSQEPEDKSPSLNVTMRGLVSLSPIVVPAASAIIALWVRASGQEEAIGRLQTELASRASAADVTRLEGTLKALTEKIERRDDRLIEKVESIATTLERVCTRVRCDR